MSDDKKIKCVVQAGKFQVSKGVFKGKGEIVHLTVTQAENYKDCILPYDAVKAAVVQPNEDAEVKANADTEGKGAETKTQEELDAEAKAKAAAEGGASTDGDGKPSTEGKQGNFLGIGGK